MKVLIVHRLIASFGGAHRYLCHLIGILNRMDCDVHLAINPSPATEKLISQLIKDNVSVHFVAFDDLSPKEAGNTFDKLLNHIQPDVVDFEAAAKSVRAFAIYSEGFNASQAVKLFTMHLPIVTDQSSLRSWKARVPYTHGWRALRERQKFVRCFDRGLSVSRYHARSIARLLRIPELFFTVIPNGVDTSVFKPAANRQSREKLKIVASGGLTPQKRFDILIEAASHLPCIDGQFEVVIAGEGAERARLERLIERFNLTKKVYLQGHVADVAEFLRSADIYVLCSDSEGMPYSAIEAMACGLPCVMTNVGELPALLRDKVDGLVIERGSPEKLASCIEVLLENPELRLGYGLSARKRVLSKYDQARVEKIVENYYTQLFKANDVRDSYV